VARCVFFFFFVCHISYINSFLCQKGSHLITSVLYPCLWRAHTLGLGQLLRVSLLCCDRLWTTLQTSMTGSTILET